MPAAEPLPVWPLDEPVFGAAVEYVLDCCDLGQEDARCVVSAMRQHHPEAYGACLQASRMSQLSSEFRFVLASQAAGLLGEEVAASLRPPSVSGDSDEVESDDGVGEDGAGEDGESDGPGEGRMQEDTVGDSGRDVAACLPTSVLEAVGSGGDEEVGAAAGGMLAASGDSSPADPAMPACLPTPSKPAAVGGGNGHGQGSERGRGREQQQPQRQSQQRREPEPVVLRSGRVSRPPGEYWRTGAQAQGSTPAAARAQHNFQHTAVRGPSETGPGRQRQ